MVIKKYVYLLITLISLLNITFLISCDLSESSAESETDKKDTAPVIVIEGYNPDTVALNSGEYQFSKVIAFDLIYNDENEIIDSLELSNDITKSGSVNTSEKGVYKVVYSVSDESENKTEVTLVVVVVDEDDVPDPDITKPVIIISGANPDTIKVGESWSLPTVTASDNKDGDLTNEIKKSGDLDNSKSGINEIIFTVSDAAGNSTEKKLVVVVINEIVQEDKIAPEIDIAGANPDTITEGETWNYPKVTASDDVDGDISSNVSKSGTVDSENSGTYKVIYTVSDKAGNEASKTLTIVVLEAPDKDAPEITISGNNPLTIKMGTTFSSPNVTAWDEKDGDLSSSISKNGNVNTSEEGTYEIVYTVEDAAGNSTSKTLVVNVIFAYPVHTNIKASTFWCGEGASGDNDFITNTLSAWDSHWGEHFGLEDHPINISRDSDFIPTSSKYTGDENPYYFALPYNDYDDVVYDGEGQTIDGYEIDSYYRKFDCYDNIHWGKDKSPSGWGYGYSLCKNRWIKVKVAGTDKVCYAQWEDAGPYYYNDYPYVFGTADPANTTDSPYAGIDLSPSVCLYLEQKMAEWGAYEFHVDWEFVNEGDVPDGPWKKHVTTRQVSWE